MDNSNISQVIGIVLIFGILFFWARINMPTEAELAAHQRAQDSIRAAMENPLPEEVAETDQTQSVQSEIESLPDSIKDLRLVATHGAFASSAKGTETIKTLENELMTIVFTNKGGRIKEVTLKKYFKSRLDSQKVEHKTVLKLLEDDKNKFEYFLPIANLPAGGVKTSDLYFTPILNGNEIIFRASAGNGRYFEQKYKLAENNYHLDYEVKLVGLEGLINAEVVQLNWVNYLDKIEQNIQYERNYSSAYYHTVEDDTDYCTCTGDDTETPEARIKWVSHSNQFFNSSLIAKGGSFQKAVLSTEMLEETSADLKKLSSQIQVPMSTGGFDMAMYIGPNEFTRMQAYDNSLEDVIPFGTSFFGTLNRWMFRPLFNFLSGFIGSKGIVILIMTLIIKMALYPLTYKMVYSQQKMAALKPRITKMREKFKDDQQAQQMETMKLYREYGVNPLGGCLPVAIQMPFWIALYRFFPAAIEFRQAPFLWAHDLSSFDVFAWLPFEVPFYGAHISLFTLLWAGTTVLYTVYNSKQMDMSAMGGGQQQKMMMYMQYFMPIMFLFFFNNYAAGLTTYLFFSNILNVSQMVATKNFLIDKNKIEAELVAYQKKPKKKGGFGQRLEAAMKEQQRLQAEKEAGKKRRKR